MNASDPETWGGWAFTGRTGDIPESPQGKEDGIGIASGCWSLGAGAVLLTPVLSPCGSDAVPSPVLCTGFTCQHWPLFSFTPAVS